MISKNLPGYCDNKLSQGLVLQAAQRAPGRLRAVHTSAGKSTQISGC